MLGSLHSLGSLASPREKLGDIKALVCRSFGGPFSFGAPEMWFCSFAVLEEPVMARRR